MQNSKCKIQDGRQKNHFYPVIFFLVGIILLTGTQSYALTIDEAVSIGLENNPQMIAAQEKVNIASAKMGEALK